MVVLAPVGPPMSRRVYLSHLDMPKGDFRYWPLAASPVGDTRGSYRGQSGRRKLQPLRQLMTHSVILPPSIAALRKVYSITSSARTSNDDGTSRPSAFAVLRLITSSNVAGCMTGRSAAFVPFRIRLA